MSRRVLVSVALVAALVVTVFVLSGPDDPAPGADGAFAREDEPVEGAAPTLRGQGEARPSSAPETPGPTDGETGDLGPIRLAVRVVASRGGVPLEGVTVTLERTTGDPLTGTTAASGEATFEWRGAGRVRLSARRDGYLPWTRGDLEFDAGEQPDPLTIQLEAGVATFGRVVRAEDGRPVVGATVTAVEGGEHAGIVSSGSGDSFGPTRTDRDGRFLFPALIPTDIYTVVVRAAGYGIARRSFFPRDAATEGTAIEVRLDPGGRVVGCVFGPDGAPKAGATVQLSLDEDYVAQTDVDGRYAVDGLVFGRPYAAVASAPGLADSEEVEGIVTTAAEPEVVVDLALRVVSRLLLRLVDEAGDPVTAAGELSLGAWPVAGWQPVRDEEVPGGWIFDGVDPGDHRLQIQVPGFLRVDRRARVAEGRATELEVALRRGAVLEGIVVDDRGEPVSGARLSAEPRDGGGWEEIDARTDESGRFRLTGLRTRPHRLDVHADGHSHARLEDVTPPRTDLRIAVERLALVTMRLRMPAGVTPPALVWLNVETEDGRSGSGEEWTEKAYEYALPCGRREFSVEGEGFASWSRVVDLEPGEALDLGTIALEEGVILQVRAVDLEDRAIAGATVAMGSVHETWRVFAPPATDGDGRALVPHLNPGSHLVLVEADGFLQARKDVEVPAAGGRIAIRLQRGGLLRARVLDAEGDPVEDARVFVRRLDPPPRHPGPHRTDTDELGIAEDRLEPGRYRVWIGDADTPTQSADVVLKEGSTEDVVLRTGGA